MTYTTAKERRAQQAMHASQQAWNHRNDGSAPAPAPAPAPARIIPASHRLPAPAKVLALPAPAIGYAVIDAPILKQALDKLAKQKVKSSLPVLYNVNIVARPGSLTLSATNLETALVIRLECKGRPYFSLCVPLASLQKMLGPIDCPLSLTKDGYTLVIRKQRAGIIRLKGMDSDEFPTIPMPLDLHYFSVDSATLIKEIERMARAAASDEARPVFTAILFQVQHGTATLASADSYRLHVSTMPLERQGIAGDTLIPVKTLTTLASILPKKAVTLHCWLSAQRSQVCFKWNGHTFVSRLIDGAFPAYQRIMPNSMPEHYAVVDAKQLQQVVALVGDVVAKDANSIINVGWRAGKQSALVIYAENEELGSQEETIPADLDQDERTHERFIMFNYRYLVDALKCFKGHAVLRFWTPQKPLTVRPLDGDDNFTAVLMPMHTGR